MDADIRIPLRVRLFGGTLLRVRPAFAGSLLKRLLRVQRLVIQTREGFFFIDPLSHLGNSLIHGSYEPRMAELLRQYLSEGDTFMDVGANEGYFSIVAGRAVGPRGKVIAVEPQQRLRAVIARNAEINRMENISVVHAAVSDVEGSTLLHLSPDMNTGSSGLHRGTRYRVRTQHIQTRRLASILDDAAISEVAMMKMDIEGFEYEAILGSPEVFKCHRVRRLALELHHNHLRERGKEPEEIIRFLEGCGYTTTDVAGIRLFVSSTA